MDALFAFDSVQPSGPWKFDAEVARVFDNMLQRSIPQYDAMRQAVFNLGSQFLRPGDTVVDLGASRGEAIAPFVGLLGEAGCFVCVEAAEPMRLVLSDRFAEQITAGTVRIVPDDLRHAYPDVKAALTLAVLTLQFTPIEHRQRIVKRIFDATRPGGAVILVEKVLGEGADVSDLLVREYHLFKQGNGYSREDVDRKALSLEGVLVPVTARWNQELLAQAGFHQVECFWRWMNFAGWIAIKAGE